MKSFASKSRRMAALGSFSGLTIGLALIVCATSCHRQANSAEDITVRETITPQPVRVGAASISLQVTDVHRGPVSGARIAVEGDMAHPGMAPVFSDAQETAPGDYESSLHLNMGGDWVVLLHITLADGRKIEKRVDVKGVQPR